MHQRASDAFDRLGGVGAAAEVSGRFQCLADPTRVRILNLLCAGELCVCHLVDILELPQPTVSRHLATLRSEGLVRVRRRGRFAHYRLAEPDDGVGEALIECVRERFCGLPELQRERQAAARHIDGCATSE